MRIRHDRPLASVGDRIVAALIDGFLLSLAGMLLFPVAAALGLGDDETSTSGCSSFGSLWAGRTRCAIRRYGVRPLARGSLPSKSSDPTAGHRVG